MYNCVLESWKVIGGPLSRSFRTCGAIIQYPNRLHGVALKYRFHFTSHRKIFFPFLHSSFPPFRWSAAFAVELAAMQKDDTGVVSGGQETRRPSSCKSRHWSVRNPVDMGLQRTKSLPAIQVTDDGANMGQQPTATQKVLIPQPKMPVLIGCGNFYHSVIWKDIDSKTHMMFRERLHGKQLDLFSTIL
jgi:hypothetical protein